MVCLIEVWKKPKPTFYFKQTELIYWPLLTLSSAASVPRQHEADYISQVSFSRMPQGTSVWKTVGLHGTAGKHAPVPAGSWHFLRLRHASCLPVFLVNRVIFCVYKSTFFSQMKSLNCQEISKKSKLAAHCQGFVSSLLLLPSREQTPVEGWYLRSLRHVTGWGDAGTQAMKIQMYSQPMEGRWRWSKTANIQKPDNHCHVELLHSHSDFQRRFTPQIPENPS